jgi:uncharacterized protein (TIGR02147 family)
LRTGAPNNINWSTLFQIELTVDLLLLFSAAMNEDLFYRNVITDELAKRSEKNSRYSLRAFAKSLGLNSGALSEILSGKRVPSYALANKIIDSLALLPETEEKFLYSLSQFQRSRGLKRLGRAFKEPKNLKTKKPTMELTADIFRVISDWYHYAILEMTFVRGFRSTPQWIASELGISVLEAKLAIDRLVSLGLLSANNGKLKKTSKRVMTTDRHLTSPALKRRQKQLLEKAISSLENDPIEKRNMCAMTMAIDPKKIPKAKK